MKIVIPGEPIPKKRHRCACRNGIPIAYDEQTTHEMAIIRQQAYVEWNCLYTAQNKTIAMEASNLAKAESFRVTCTFLFPPPRYDNQFNRNAKLWGFQPHNVKPDFDNLAKLYIDCLKGIIWDDDCRVTIGVSKKGYDEKPRTEIDVVAETGLAMNPEAKKVLCVFSPSELADFIVDAHELVYPYEYVNPIDENECDAESLEMAAIKLADFAYKFGDKIRKLQKFKLIKPFKDSIEEIDSGKFDLE